MESQGLQSRNETVICPACQKLVEAISINEHLDNSCSYDASSPSSSSPPASSLTRPEPSNAKKPAIIAKKSIPIAPIFQSAHHQVKGSNRNSFDKSVKKRRNSVTGAPYNATSKRIKTEVTSVGAVVPLAERVRPRQLQDFVGQSHLLGPDSLLSILVSSGSMDSIILWGPPGCGKTTLARLLACATSGSNSVFKELSATSSNTAEVRSVLEESQETLHRSGRQTTVFLDGIHRFNKAQQDIFLPYVEQGHIRLIGATTENPSFTVTSALLSRCRVLVLESLNEQEVMTVLQNAISVVRETSSAASVRTTPSSSSGMQERGCQSSSQATLGTQAIECQSSSPFTPFPHITDDVLSTIVSLAAGDARRAVSLLDIALKCRSDVDERSLLSSLKRSVAVTYDRRGDDRYDMISALHKSVRGSDPDAALYWLARMLNAGEDPLYIVRRMIVCASEDIGVADVHALPLATATLQACQAVGMPECRINLAHLIVHLSEAPKSTRAYEGYKRAEAAAKLNPSIPVPPQMRNAPTPLMKEIGCGRDYAYNPDYIHPVHNTYLPIHIQGQKFLKKEGDISGKRWDEDALRRWELETNGGKNWEGRKAYDISDTVL